MPTTQATLDPSDQSQPTTSPDAKISDPDLQLSYENETGNAIVVRSYDHHGDFVREVAEEYMFNYVKDRWECSTRFVHDYDLTEDGDRLAGDGSNWRGTGREWGSWFTARHYTLLELRFQHDTIPDPDTVENHNPVERPV